MATNSVVFYTPAFMTKVAEAASSVLTDSQLASFNTKLAEHDAIANTYNITCAIDRLHTANNIVHTTPNQLLVADREAETTYANRSIPFANTMLSRAYEVVNQGRKVHFLLSRPNLPQMAALGAIKYAMNHPASNNSLSNLTVWTHGRLANNNATGDEGTISSILKASKKFNVKIVPMHYGAPSKRRSGAASYTKLNDNGASSDNISTDDVVVFGHGYHNSDQSPWNTYYRKIRFGQNYTQFCITSKIATGDIVNSRWYDFYGSEVEKRIIGLSSSGADMPDNDVRGGMKKCVHYGESNTTHQTSANTWCDNYASDNTFTIRPGTDVTVEGNVVNPTQESTVIAICSDGDIIRSTDSVDYSQFINKEIL